MCPALSCGLRPDNPHEDKGLGSAAQTDLQFRLRCQGCNHRDGFRITIFDERTRGDNSKPRLERVVVAGE